MIIASSLSTSLYAQLRSSGLARQDGTGALASDPAIRRLQEAQQGLAQLKAQPSSAQQAKQAAAEKLHWLKQRLNALKMLLMGASPQDAKALLRELKSIARELASVARSLGAGSGGSAQDGVGASVVVADAGGAAAQEAAISEAGPSEAAASTAAAQEAQADDSDDAVTGATGGDDDEEGQDGAAGSASTASALRGDGGDQSLKEALMEVRRLFKSVLGMLKSKLGAPGHKTREELQAAERDFAEFDKRMGQLAGEEEGNKGQTTISDRVCVRRSSSPIALSPRP